MSEPLDYNLARAARANGMSVAEWIRHCDGIEAREKSRRRVDRMMRQVPSYRDAA